MYRMLFSSSQRASSFGTPLPPHRGFFARTISMRRDHSRAPIQVVDDHNDSSLVDNVKMNSLSHPYLPTILKLVVPCAVGLSRS